MTFDAFATPAETCKAQYVVYGALNAMKWTCATIAYAAFWNFVQW